MVRISETLIPLVRSVYYNGIKKKKKKKISNYNSESSENRCLVRLDIPIFMKAYIF